MPHYMVAMVGKETIIMRENMPKQGQHAEVAAEIRADVAVGPCKDVADACVDASTIMASLYPHHSWVATAVSSTIMPIRLKDWREKKRA